MQWAIACPQQAGLRRHGGPDGEGRLWTVITELLSKLTTDKNLTLDIDTTLIEADKGDAEMSYKGLRGYQPLLGMCVEAGLCVGSRFQQGNISPQSDLASFIRECCQRLPDRITTVRSDSAAYNHDVINPDISGFREPSTLYHHSRSG